MEDVIEFCRKFGIPLNDEPGPIDSALLLQRVGLIREEVIELTDAADELVEGESAYAAERLLDAAVDLVYATMATVASFGFDFEEAWRRVHAANMAKEAALSNDNKRGSTYDVVKPEGWEAPFLGDLVYDITVRDLLCEKNGSTFAWDSLIPSNLTSTVARGKSSPASRGDCLLLEKILSSMQSGTPDISSGSLSETTSSVKAGEPLSYCGNGEWDKLSTGVSDFPASPISLREEKSSARKEPANEPA